MQRDPIFPRDRVTIVGVLNCTPDSFSDGGRLVDSNGRAVRDALLRQARALLDGGADVLDVGGESTRPGAVDVSTACEIERTCDPVAWLTEAFEAPVSIDTRKADVARAACEAGARLVNDVSGGDFDPAILAVAAEAGADVLLGHLHGTPQTMHRIARSDDVLLDVVEGLAASIAAAEAAGVPRARIAADPGIGFGKSPEQNFELLAHAGWLRERLQVPVCVGPSRKGFLRAMAGESLGALDALDAASHAACAVAVFSGADAVRVHEAAGARRAVAVARAARDARRKELS